MLDFYNEIKIAHGFNLPIVKNLKLAYPILEALGDKEGSAVAEK